MTNKKHSFQDLSGHYGAPFDPPDLTNIRTNLRSKQTFFLTTLKAFQYYQQVLIHRSKSRGSVPNTYSTHFIQNTQATSPHRVCQHATLPQNHEYSRKTHSGTWDTNSLMSDDLILILWCFSINSYPVNLRGQYESKKSKKLYIYRRLKK